MQGGSHENQGDNDEDLGTDDYVDLDIDVDAGQDNDGVVFDILEGLLWVGDVYS